MKLLYIIPSFQHPAMRGSARHYYFIRELSQRHVITLLVLCKNPPAPAAREEMSRYVQRLFTFAINKSGEPCRAHNGGLPRKLKDRVYRLLQMRSALKNMERTFKTLVQAEPFDLVLFHGKNVYPVIKKYKGLPIVADFCDATSTRLRQSLFYGNVAKLPFRVLRYWKFRHIDLELLKKTPYLAFISLRDLEAMGRRSGTFKVIPNGVDLRYWARKTKDRNSNCLVFTGVMDYRPNADAALYFIEKILPLIRRQIPDIEVFIAGRNPLPELIKAAHHYPDIKVTGFVEDIRPYLEQASVYVAPLRFASGMQNKLLEAMAMEVPIVATSAAAAGLRLEDGTQPPLVEADGEVPFAESTVRLLRGKEERTRLKTDGRRFVKEHFDWIHGARMLEQMCVEAIAHEQQFLNGHGKDAGHEYCACTVLSA